MDGKKMKMKNGLRALILIAVLGALWLNNAPVETLAIVAAFFGALFFLKGRAWRLSEHILEEHLPFTKQWPKWAEKILLIAMMILFYYLLKLILYAVLGFFGIDFTQMLMESVGADYGAMKT